jgi:hypothetical protein
MENSMKAEEIYKTAQDVKAKQCGLKEGYFAHLANQAFLGKNKKIVQRWIGPYLVTRVINDLSVKMQILPKRILLHLAYILKSQTMNQMNFKHTRYEIKRGCAFWGANKRMI